MHRTSGAARLFLCLLAAVFILVSASPAQEAAHSTGWVVIPVSEYGALRAKAFPVEREPDPSPVDATLTRVDYELRIGGDLADGRASLTVDVLKDGWVRVPIPAGLLVREARLDGKLVSLVAGAGGKSGAPLSLVLSKRGRAVVTLDVALPIVSAAGNEKLSLPSSASGVTRASVALPRQEVEVTVAGGLLSEKSESATESKWIAYATGSEPLSFTWRRRMENHRVVLPLRLRGSLTQLAGLGEDSTSIYAEADLEVAQGAARQVRIQVPASVTVNQVLGALVSDWDVKGGELVVTFLEPVEQSAKFVVTGETRLPRDGAIEIPLLRLLDTERETGAVAVEVLGAGEIKDVKTQGLESADASDLGPTIASRESPSLVAFRFRPGPQKDARSLALRVVRYAQQAVLTANVEEARYRVLMSEEGKTLTQARYAVRNTQRNFVKIALPAGAVVWSASMSGRPVRPGQAPDGGLLFPLEKAPAGEDAPAFAIEVLYLGRGAAWNDKGRATLTLPAIDLPVSRTGLVLYYPPMFRVTAEPGSFRTESYETPSSAALNPGAARALEVEKKSPAQRPASQADFMNSLSNSALVGGNRAQNATQVLVDNYKAKSEARKGAGALPIRVSFPAVGPSLFLVSELTSENQGPTLDLSYQRERKGGAR
jgi:hypothetical protein